MVAEEMAFPVDRENALSLIQLTLGMLEKKMNKDKNGEKILRRILRRSEGSGRGPDEERECAEW